MEHDTVDDRWQSIFEARCHASAQDVGTACPSADISSQQTGLDCNRPRWHQDPTISISTREPCSVGKHQILFPGESQSFHRDHADIQRGTPVFDEPPGEARKPAESATKTRFDLVPWEEVKEIAQVLTFGAQKYGDNNWCRGARWGRYFRALCSHIFQWWRGENLDPETGRSHLAHAGCCLLFLMAYQRNGWGTDDRFVAPDGKPFVKHDGVSDAEGL